MATAAAPFIIAVEPLPSVCANAAKPPNANVPFIKEVKSTSLNCLSPTPAKPTEAPNNAIAAAPLRTLLSPNFLTASAIDFRKPPLLPPLVIADVVLSALDDAPESILDTLEPMPCALSLSPFGINPEALSFKPPNMPPAVEVIFPTTSGAPALVSLLINPVAIDATLLATSLDLLNIIEPYADAYPAILLDKLFAPENI